jgi:succinate dehydrogenase / fumarate reductase flavoprotein subunit
MTLESRAPMGPIDTQCQRHKDGLRLVAPTRRRRYEVIIIGSGLAGASAAATLAEQGYRVQCFCYQDSAWRAHSVAAQGGINAAKNYQNDGDSLQRLFHDTIKGGDFHGRGARSLPARPTCEVNRGQQKQASPRSV